MKRLACFLHVTTRDGHPLAGIKFAVEQAEGPVPEIGYVTDNDGGARLGLPIGKVVLRFFPRDRESRLVSLAIVDEPNQTYEVRIDEEADQGRRR